MAAAANRRKKAGVATPAPPTDDAMAPADSAPAEAIDPRRAAPARGPRRLAGAPHDGATPPAPSPAAPPATATGFSAAPEDGSSGAHTPMAAQLLELGAAAATVRRALFNERLEDALEMMVQVAADVLAPAVAQVWVAEQTPRTEELSRTGGQPVAPVLRRRAMAARAISTGQWPLASLGALADEAEAHGAASPSVPLPPAAPEGLVREVASTRRALVLRETGSEPLAQAWLVDAAVPWLELATLAAYPLVVRGQMLGVFVMGTARALGPHHLATLEAAADGCAMAVERDQLLQYTQTQEALAQTVVRQAPVAVCVLAGKEHIFELANPAFTQLLGVDGPIQGRRLADMLVGVERLSETLRLDAVYATGEVQAMVELPVQVGRGLTYWNVTSSPLLDRGGRVRGVLVAAVDMTHAVQERGAAMAAARAERERVRQMTALHETSLALAGQLGADPRELLADILRRSIDLLEARAGVVYLAPTGGPLEVTVAQGLRGQYIGQRVALDEGLAGQVAREGKGDFRDDSRLYDMRPAFYANEGVTAMIAVPLVQQQRVVGVLEVLNDADQRPFTKDDLRLLELFAAQAAQGVENARTYVELERAYQAQRELDRMKDDFIATASHELRTPLTGVRGYLELLLDYQGSRDDGLAVEFLARAAESAAELEGLTTRLLHTARLESGQIETRSETLGARALEDMIEQVIQAQRAAAQPSDGDRGRHRFAVEIAPALRVWADARRLRDVLTNLVSNAVKYSPDGGVVRIAGWAADPSPDSLGNAGGIGAGVAGEAARGFGLLTVSDSGIGIAPGERSRLFGRFARLDAARTSQIRGTGLGLYICRQLMEAMGGTIWLESSAPGQGSTFALALPLATDALAGPTPAP